MNILNRFLSRFTQKMMSGENWKKGFMFPNTGEKTTRAYAQSTLVYSAIRAIATNLPQVKLKFWYPDTEEDVPSSHQLYSLFKRPNKEDTYYTFIEKATTFLALTGECFIWKRPSAGGTYPSELYVLNPYLMKEKVSVDRRVLLGWVYDSNIPILPEELFYIKFPNPYSNFRGLAPLDSCIADIDSDYLSAKYGKSFYANSAVPGLIFTTSIDDESTPEQRKSFLNEWNALHKGSTQAYKSAVLAGGMDVKAIGLDQKAMQYIESRRFNAIRVLSSFGVPPPMVGIFDDATYGNIKTAKRMFWNECIKTYALRFENEFNKWLMDIYDPDIECYFDFSQVDELKHDATELAQVVNIYANHGIPMNDLITAFELPFDKVDGLNVGYYPMSMIPVGTTINDYKNESTPPKDDENDKKPSKDDESDSKNDEKDKNFTNLFVKELKNYFFNQRSKICEFIAKNDKNGLETIRNGVAALFKGENQRLLARMAPIYAQLGGKLNDDIILINITTKNQVLKIIDEEKDPIIKIKSLYNSYNKSIHNGLSRIEMIAKAEIELIFKETTDE